ncbi:MAG: BA14K family protein [Hyphomicrobiaceae bacterium]
MTIIRTARAGMIPAIAAMAAATALSVAQPASAAPVAPGSVGVTMQSPAAPALNSKAASVQLAQYHRGRHWRHRGWHGGRHWRHRRGWRGYGPGIVGSIAGAIIGGSIIASQRDHRDAWDRCDARYRSFRWSDGTFQPYGDGPRQLCPYLAR